MRTVLIGLLFSSVASAAVAGAAPAWRISESSGGVFVQSRGVSKAALGGGEVAAGDTVSTAANGRVVLVRGQEYMVVAPNSRFRVVEPTSTDSLTQIFEELGNVVFKINKQAAPHFAVQTPYLAAVVKGTTFSVTVTGSGSSVQVTEGAVQVATLDGRSTDLILPGMIGIVGRDRQQLMVDNGQGVAPAAPAAGSAPPAALDNASPIAPAAANVVEPSVAVIAAQVEQAPLMILPQAPLPTSPMIAQPVVAGPSAFSQASVGQTVGDPSVTNAITEAVHSQPIAVASSSGTDGLNASTTGSGGLGESVSNPGSSNPGDGNGDASSADSGSGAKGSAGKGDGSGSEAANGNSGNGNGGNAGNNGDNGLGSQNASGSSGNGNGNGNGGNAGNNGDSGNGNANGNGNGNSGNGNSGNGNGNAGNSGGSGSENASGNSGNGNGDGNGGNAGNNGDSGNGNANGNSGNANGNGNSGNGSGASGGKDDKADKETGNGKGNNGNGNGNGGNLASGVQITLGGGITIQINDDGKSKSVVRIGGKSGK